MSLSICPLCDEQQLKKIKIEWIQCEPCNQWYHNDCIKLSTSEANAIASYHCANCISLKGPSVLKRKSKRRKTNIDYVALNEGNKLILDKTKHHHIERFLSFEDQVENPIDIIKGTELTKEYALESRIAKPVYISQKNAFGLDMKMPSDLTVTKIADYIGEDEPIEVMDVLNQNGCPNWSVGLWRDYFNSSESDRDRTRNVISLEISKCDLNEFVKRPKFVEDLDLVDKVWPRDNENERPQVTKYCLMSVKDSFTDFHIDFGGTSVYYTVLTGMKVFLLFPPTESNLTQYEKWCLLPDQNITWFGDIASDGFKINLHPGDCMIIPSGWIHAVYTPIDTVVIGGNFLTLFNIPTQLRISDVEVKTKVPRKFTFPRFYTVMWLTAWYYFNGNIHEEELASDLERKVMSDLLEFLKKEYETSKMGEPKSKKLAKESIPKEIGKPDVFLMNFEKWVLSLNEVDEKLSMNESNDICQEKLPLKQEDSDGKLNIKKE